MMFSSNRSVSTAAPQEHTGSRHRARARATRVELGEIRPEEVGREGSLRGQGRTGPQGWRLYSPPRGRSGNRRFGRPPARRIRPRSRNPCCSYGRRRERGRRSCRPGNSPSTCRPRCPSAFRTAHRRPSRRSRPRTRRPAATPRRRRSRMPEWYGRAASRFVYLYLSRLPHRSGAVTVSLHNIVLLRAASLILVKHS